MIIIIHKRSYDRKPNSNHKSALIVAKSCALLVNIKHTNDWTLEQTYICVTDGPLEKQTLQ